MNRRRLLLTIIAVVAGAAFVRVGYEPFAWGGYWHGNIVPFWQR